ncbi:transporter substrate-binding domain-containing protein [Vibrio profundum]|uniref:substrate-binding periplasmic protein n=1 Tax=Vibrio profundum TaxID=2910247 RepID=UPI003D0E1CE4
MKKIILIFILVYSSITLADEVRIGMSINAPYQVEDTSGLSGSVVALMKCSLDKLETPYKISVYPWKRSVGFLRASVVDIIFSYEQNSALDSVAQFSTPLVLESWYWYWTKTLPEVNGDYHDSSIAVVLGSSQERWLADNQYKKVHPVLSIEQALGLLSIGRVDLLLSDSTQIEATSQKMGIDLGKFGREFIRFSTLGAYISNKFIKNNPNYFALLNESIKSCEPVGSKLNKKFKSVLDTQARAIAKVAESSVLIESISASNKKMDSIDFEEISKLDQTWIEERKSQSGELIQRIMSNKLSSYLREIKTNHPNLYTEIFAMNKHGLNVGQSDITSDYWQGDESKFINTFGLESKEAFIDDIKYDHSTHLFQSQISISVFKENKAIGAITFGVNVEEALRLSSETLTTNVSRQKSP